MHERSQTVLGLGICTPDTELGVVLGAEDELLAPVAEEIGDYSFVGSNTSLIAPLRLGKGVYTAAGTTVTRDVPDYALAIDRGELKVNEGYTLRKMKAKK